MSVDFKIKDFAYPVEILALRGFFEQSQWFDAQRLLDYQHQRLKAVLDHCYRSVPYYRRVFDDLNIKPDDFKAIADLKKLPLLDKNSVRENFQELTARDFKRFSPYLCRTSGTSAEPVEFYLDKPANILEFCYYWRYWSWAGYRLGMPFAEFSLHHFLGRPAADRSQYLRLTNRLILNPLALSPDNIKPLAAELRRRRCGFLKGTPSVIHTFAFLLNKAGLRDLKLKAVFTTGEKLLGYQRRTIEDIFACPVRDSYGHMERTVGICQCPQGRYHINPEYGIIELEPRDDIVDVGGVPVGEIVGTSLHKFAMPFLRYRTGDLVLMDENPAQCACGRKFPVVKEIYGRAQDVIISLDRRFIANLFVIFNFIDGVTWYKIIQEKLDQLRVLAAVGENVSRRLVEGKIRYYLERMLGKGAGVIVEFVDVAAPCGQKHKPVESRLKMDDFV